MSPPENKLGTTEQQKEQEAEYFVIKTDDETGKHEIKLTTQDIRQGHTGDHLRYILGGSLLAAVVVMAVVALLF